MKPKKSPRKPPTIITTMRIPQDVLAAADDRADEQGLSRNRYVVTLIQQDAKRRRSRPGNTAPAAETANDIFG